MNNQTTFTITAGTIIKTIVIGILFYLLYYLRDIALILITAVVIASAIEPITSWFVVRRVPRMLAVLFIYGCITAFAIGFFYLFLPTLLADTASLLSSMPSYIEKVDANNPFAFGDMSLPTMKEVVAKLSTLASDATIGFFGTLSGIFGGLLSFVLIVVLSFYLSVQKDGVTAFLRIIVPDQYEDYILGLWKRSQIKIGLWMQGQIVLSLLVGVLTYLVLSLLGVSNAMVLALIAAVFELIPVFGMILSTVPAMAIALADGGVTLMFIVLGVYILIQQFENHLFYPLVVRKIVGIPALFVIVALIIGAKLAGFLGILLAVPLAAVAMEILNDLEKKKASRHITK